MEIIRTVSWMKHAARQARAENHVIGVVPTMGALHEGHLSLIRRAKQECSRVFVSIFVNPTQFGANEDLGKYPRTWDADLAKLEADGVDVVFAPDAKEIYPAGFSSYVTVEGLSDRLEGESRPGHFRGVATVVLKLFEIVQPHQAFFGRKDAQQAAVLEQMVRDLNLDAEIVVCPLVREADGLALSSRNVYLSTEERRAALVLSRSLREIQAAIAGGERDVVGLQHKLLRILSAEKLAGVDYATIVDAETFEPVISIGARVAYALLAVFIGQTRLIDNLLIEPGSKPGELICSL
jgi:pantoate--beta-alanine ligase